MRAIIHILLHVLVPVTIALLFYRQQKLRAAAIMLAGISIDLDHLLATPVYHPARCSIGFHPLHSYWIIPVYFTLLFFTKTRLLGIGLVAHIVLDTIDCLWMSLES